MTIEKQVYEAQLQQIFRMLLENKTNEQIASELKISVRTVQNFKQRIDKRYGDFQRHKTDNTLFMECQLFKNRMLTLYKCLEATVMYEKTSGTYKAKCAEVAANIAIDVLKLERESIKAVKELMSVEQKKSNLFNNLRNDNDKYDDDHGPDIDSHNQQQYHQEEQEEDDNRKF